MKINYTEGVQILNNLDIPLYLNDNEFKPTLAKMGFKLQSVGPYSVTARVDSTTRQALKDYAAGQGISVGDVVREALELYLKGK